MHPPDTIMIFAFWPLAGQRSAYTAMRPCGEQSRRSAQRLHTTCGSPAMVAWKNWTCC